MSNAETRIVEEFHRLYYNEMIRTWTSTFWFGTPTLKCPLDLWVYQEIIHELKPDLIIETGTAGGGSALFLASLCELVGNGRVVTIDIERDEARVEHARIEYVQGSSTSGEVVERVRSLAQVSGVVMVILDSDHSKEHVLEELSLFSPFVTPGSYLIVEDTCVNGHPVLPDFGPGPREAVEEFLAQDGDFVVDPSKEKFFLTFNPGGYLKRSAPNEPAPSTGLDIDPSDQQIGKMTTRDSAVRAPMGQASVAATDSADLYLDLMKKCLTRMAFGERYRGIDLPSRGGRRALLKASNRVLGLRGLAVVRRSADLMPEARTFDPDIRAQGLDWPAEAETMVGLHRLDNVQHCVTDVVRNGVPGDLIETGVWRGGVTIFMRAILKAYGDSMRTVWVADSFRGLPKPDADRYPADEGLDFTPYDALAVPVEQVQANFARYGLLDDQVRFLVGWFRDTLPLAPIQRLAVMRLDGDLYESTMDALRALYPKLSVGGYVIVDDYGAIPACKQAVEDYRAEHGITEPVETVDWTGAYWQRRS